MFSRKNCNGLRKQFYEIFIGYAQYKQLSLLNYIFQYKKKSKPLLVFKFIFIQKF